MRYTRRMIKRMIYLASKSPRRKELLAQIGVPFSTVSVEVDETPHMDEPAEQLVQRLAQAKAEAGLALLKQTLNIMHQQSIECSDIVHAQRLKHPLVLGSDTVVVLDGEALGKPSSSSSHAFDTLQRLSGQTHQVMTAVSLSTVDASQTLDKGLGKPITQTVLSTSEVRFAPLSKARIGAYLETGEPFDKAGAYGIQGAAAALIEHLSGSYSGVMGLPLHETAQLLHQASVPIW